MERLHEHSGRFGEWIEVAQLAGVGDISIFKNEIILALKNKSLDYGIPYYLERDGKIMATSFLKTTEFDGDISVTIFHVAVLPDLRGRGIGKNLMELTFNEAASYGKEIVILFTTTQAEFYKACGMTALGAIPGMVDGAARHFFYKKPK